MDRFKEAKEIIKHRRAINKLAKQYGFWFPFHDLHKLINTILFGDKLATKWHRRFSRHHMHYNKRSNSNIIRTAIGQVEAVFDWECARFTKPEKPLDARETFERYYKDRLDPRIADLIDFIIKKYFNK